MGFHLAQVNVAYAVADLDSPAMAGFVRAQPHVNRAADANDGLVWRLQDESGGSTNVPFLNDDRWVVNLSVWRSMADLEAFTFSDPHRKIMAMRKKWFEPHDKPATACWWVPAGHLPDTAEAERMLTRLWAEGSSDAVFALGAGAVPAPPAT